MSNGADIRDIDALSSLKAAFGRFGEEVLRIIPSLQKQFEEIEEWLDQRQQFWEGETDRVRQELYEARNEMDRCHSRAETADEDDHVDCIFEEQEVADAERHLSQYEDNLQTVKQWRHRIEGQISDFQKDIHRLSHLASERNGSAQAFLAEKLELLGRYTDDYSSRVAGLQISAKNDNIRVDTIRQSMLDAQYVSCLPYEAEDSTLNVNESYILEDHNGLKVFFKPSDGEHEGVLYDGIPPKMQYRREKAASLVDEIFGIGLVPPTEIIKYKHKGRYREGSAQLFKTGFYTAFRFYREGKIELPVFDKLSDRQRQDWHLLDEVLGNVDRHDRNWMLQIDNGGVYKIALIDNGLCLSETGYDRLKAAPAAYQKIDALNRLRLKEFLTNEKAWRSRLVDLVGDASVAHMINRARELIERGYYKEGFYESNSENSHS